MRSVRALLLRLFSVFGRSRRDAELSAELSSHVQSHIDDGLRAGLTWDEARRRALLTLGGVERTKSMYREQRGVLSIERAVRELRQAFERLRRSPAFTSAAVLSLALAIAANVSIFAVVERVVIHPLPYPQSQQLIMLDFAVPARNIASGFNSITTRQYFHYADNARTLDSLAVYRADDRTLTGQGSPERIRVLRTTPSLASVLRAAPMEGAWLPDGPRGALPAAAVLSYGFWVRRFGADRRMIGRSIALSGVTTTVVGIMPPSFTFPDPSIDAWINEPRGVTDDYSFSAVARLRDAVTIGTARAEITQLSRTLQAVAPGQGYEMLASTAPLLQDFMVGPISTALWILLGSAAVVLLVACANIANLFLVRSEARQREIGVRRALGAGAGGVAAYFFAESALLSAAGAALGLIIASYAIRALVALGPVDLPRLHEVTLAPVHLLFTLALGFIATVMFGLVPLLRLGLSRVPLQEGPRGATTGLRSLRTRQILMAGQVALALTLLVASGLLFRSFQRLRAADPGFDATSTLTFEVGLPRSEYVGRPRIAATHRAIVNRLSALPGVTSASVVNCVPLSGHGYCGGAPLFIEGEALPPGAVRPVVAIRPVASSFFDAMGMRPLRGRVITRADVDGSVPVTVISDSLARAAFGTSDPIGRRIRLGPHAFNRAPLWFTVIGVVKTTPIWSVTEARPAPQMYIPLFPTEDVFPSVDVMTYVVRTAVPTDTLVSAARSAVREIDPNLAISQVRTLQDLLDSSAAPRAFTMVLIVIAASTALLLGIVGIYGVMSYIVSQRTNEIGVRLALGAQPARVMRMVIHQGGVVTACGIGVGLVTSLAGSRFLASLLYGIGPRDPGVFAVTTVTLTVVALAACWLPARRAASVDPLIALRAE
jgi:predicted permease